MHADPCDLQTGQKDLGPEVEVAGGSSPATMKLAAWVELTREIRAGDAFVRDAPAEIRSLATQLAQLAPAEQQAAGAGLREFITYVSQRDG
jgi:hypothetical protein